MIRKISLSTFVPDLVLCGKYQNPYPISIKSDEDYLLLSYITLASLGKREYSLSIPKFVTKNNETFEVLGLLQAEMGKTYTGGITFPNHEYKLINKVIGWFEKELNISSEKWGWYITLNINKPEDQGYKEEIEKKVVKHWLAKTKIKDHTKNPTTVSYIKNTKNKKLKPHDYGTLSIQYKSNLFSQIIKRFVKIILENIVYLNDEYIRSFMKGIIAGEGSVVYHKKSGHSNVRISACKKEERDIYQVCLNQLDIEIKQYENYKEMVISKRENLVKLLQQRLITLSPSKYVKFFNMMQQYPNIEKETGYFKPKGQNIWNKFSKEVIDKIIELYKNSPGIPTKQIAENVGVSQIKIQRVLKENNLGKRLVKTPERLREQISEFANQNPNLKQYEIAEKFNVHESVVRRAIKKYL